MHIEKVNKVLDLILENKTVQNIDLVKNQKNNIRIEKIEDSENSKYITFYFDKIVDRVDNLVFGVLSVMFWELTQDIPIDCILHLKNGYMDSLEIYSCDGRGFEDIDISNIDIRDRNPSDEI